MLHKKSSHAKTAAQTSSSQAYHRSGRLQAHVAELNPLARLPAVRDDEPSELAEPYVWHGAF